MPMWTLPLYSSICYSLLQQFIQTETQVPQVPTLHFKHICSIVVHNSHKKFIHLIFFFS